MYLTADDITVESDERGFELHISSAEEDTIIVNIQAIAEEVYDRVKAAIGPWLRERDEAFAEFKQAARYGTGPAAAYFACRDGDIDESGGYALDDPKHPTYHERMSEIADSRDAFEVFNQEDR